MYLGVGVIGEGDGLFPARRDEAEVNDGAVEVYLIQEGIWDVFSETRTSRCPA